MNTIYDNFQSLDIRVGKIVSAKLRDDLIRPAIQLKIDFGPEIGVLESSAQITDRYQAENLMNVLIIALINVTPRQIANIMSECLVLGLESEEGVVLITPDANLPIGSKLA